MPRKPYKTFKQKYQPNQQDNFPSSNPYGDEGMSFNFKKGEMYRDTYTGKNLKVLAQDYYPEFRSYDYDD